MYHPRVDTTEREKVKESKVTELEVVRRLQRENTQEFFTVNVLKRYAMKCRVHKCRNNYFRNLLLVHVKQDIMCFVCGVLRWT